MPAFGNPNQSNQNPFKPGQPTVGMQPFNQLNALTGRVQAQAGRPLLRNSQVNAGRGGPSGGFRPNRPGGFGSSGGAGRASSDLPGSLLQRAFSPYMATVSDLLGGMVPPVMPYLRPPNIDLYGALLGEYRDLTGTSLPLLDALLGQELDMESLIESQSSDLLRQLLDATQATPNPRPRSGTSFFRGFSG